MKRAPEDRIIFKLGQKVLIVANGPHCVRIVALVVCAFLVYVFYRVFSLLYTLASPWLQRLLNG